MACMYVCVWIVFCIRRGGTHLLKRPEVEVSPPQIEVLQITDKKVVPSTHAQPSLKPGRSCVFLSVRLSHISVGKRQQGARAALPDN